MKYGHKATVVSVQGGCPRGGAMYLHFWKYYNKDYSDILEKNVIHGVKRGSKNKIKIIVSLKAHKWYLPIRNSTLYMYTKYYNIFAKNHWTVSRHFVFVIPKCKDIVIHAQKQRCYHTWYMENSSHDGMVTFLWHHIGMSVPINWYKWLVWVKRFSIEWITI